MAVLVEAIAATDYAGVQQRGGPPGGFGCVFLQPRRFLWGVSGIRARFRSHGSRIWGSQRVVNDAARCRARTGAFWLYHLRLLPLTANGARGGRSLLGQPAGLPEDNRRSLGGHEGGDLRVTAQEMSYIPAEEY